MSIAAPHSYRVTMSARRAQNRGGFSLLEVVLALAILLVALVMLGELVRLGTMSAAGARDLTQAQLLCESKMAEITSGISTPDPVQLAPFELDPEWLYSVSLEPVDAPGVMLLRVTVSQNLTPAQRPAEFSLARFIQDPGLELTETDPYAAEASGSTITTSAGGAGGTP